MARHQAPRATPARESPTARRLGTPPTFSRILGELVNKRPETSGSQRGESLAPLAYDAEVVAKNEALATFWRTAGLPGCPVPLVRSPQPRGYRTTSKRRVELRGRAVHLLLAERHASKGAPRFTPSPLEPVEHAHIYRFLLAKLSDPAFRVVTEHLRWLIVRGSYAEPAVIFNVNGLFGPLVRKLKILGRHLSEHKPPIVGAFVYVDETESDYYLEARRTHYAMRFKKLFGPDLLRVSYGDLRLSFHPTSFCQVNESIVPQMLRLAEEMLAPRAGERLIDLYCGCGLFSFTFADRVRAVIGVDAEGPSIAAAQTNARKLGRGNTRFIASRITAESIEKLPGPSGDEIVVLDPPRNGTENGVIEAIAARRPRRVLHVFCSVDEIPGAFRQWTTVGYLPQRVVPLDMFPGTPSLEVLVQLEPADD